MKYSALIVLFAALAACSDDASRSDSQTSAPVESMRPMAAGDAAPTGAASEVTQLPDAAVPPRVSDAAVLDAGSLDRAAPSAPAMGETPEVVDASVTAQDAGSAAPDAEVASEPDAEPEPEAEPETPLEEAAGACSGSADRALFADPSFDPEAAAPACVVPMALGGGGPGTPGFVSGVAECLAEDTGISTECATCYAMNAECSFASCGVICLPDRNSKECRDCRCGRTSDVNCFTLLAACTGIPTDYCD